MAHDNALWDAAYMEPAEETPLQRFARIAIEQSGKARDHLDKKIQLAGGTKGKPLYDLGRGKAINPGGHMQKLMADALGQPFDLLARAAGGERVDPIRPDQADGQPDTPPVQNASEGETTPIVALDLSLSMGPGTPIEDFIESEPVEFDIGLLRSITRSPYHRLRFVRGIGDSMQPKFFTGDRILVDTTERTLSRLDGYYWITLWGAHGLKKLRPIGQGRVAVISENRENDPIEVDADELTIEGRAIWFGRDL